MGFAEADTATLRSVRRNLLRGLDRVAEHLDAGTLHVIPDGRATPPAQSGWLAMVLLEQVDAELATRVPVPIG